MTQRTTLIASTTALTTLVLGLSLLAWSLQQRAEVTLYDLFPLLGLFAFGLMWMHYISGSLKRGLGLTDDAAVLKRYFAVTAYVVLVLIVLHPGLLYYGAWRDGFGPPPLGTWAIYTDTVSRIALLMGSVSLTAFLLFELHRWFSSKPWWKYIEYLNIFAMGLILVHALLIGGELMQSWFRTVWIIMGCAFIASVIYNYRYDHIAKRQNKEIS